MVSPRTPSAPYDPAFYGPLAGIDDRHFWFRHRNRVLRRLVGELAARTGPECRILEAGCGNGNVLRVLEQCASRGTVVGIDLYQEGLSMARSRCAALLVRGDVHLPPFRHGFHVIGAFDVIEHLEDDRKSLRAFAHLLNPGGALIVTVPAHMSLWSYFDGAGHYRRYTPETLRAAIEECGLQVEYLTEYMWPLYPVLWLGRRIAPRLWPGRAQSSAAAPDFSLLPVLNELFLWLLALELPLLRRRARIPFGSSLLAIARKPAFTPSQVG